MITMKRTFSLSANIENGFADGAQYIVTPNAQLAIRNIVIPLPSSDHTVLANRVSCWLWSPT